MLGLCLFMGNTACVYIYIYIYMRTRESKFHIYTFRGKLNLLSFLNISHKEYVRRNLARQT